MTTTPVAPVLGQEDLALIEKRNNLMGPAYRLLYDHPVHFVRGQGVHLYDLLGEEYLDAYNNVPCIGHSHPAVTAAVSQQLSLLNTNTRYLQDNVVDFAETLLATMPPEISNVMFTCTGSEANDLALRVAELNTGNTGIIVTESAYHGVTAAVSAMSPSLGTGVNLAPQVRTIAAPDLFVTGLTQTELEAFMVQQVSDAIADLQRHGHGVSALVLDSLFASDGILPEATGWIAAAADLVREAGGLYIADEVQSGFGRLGTSMWGFARHQVVPDIVTMGKSMGNGIPIAAAAFRPELLTTFGPSVRYFNTFGGNSVSIAAASAVLKVISQENLIAKAAKVGQIIGDGLAELAANESRIGCTRGIGLAHGVVFVSPETGTPDPALAKKVVNQLREKHVLISSCGQAGNVLKIRPPLVFNDINARQLLTALGEVLTESAN